MSNKGLRSWKQSSFSPSVNGAGTVSFLIDYFKGFGVDILFTLLLKDSRQGDGFDLRDFKDGDFINFCGESIVRR